MPAPAQRPRARAQGTHYRARAARPRTGHCAARCPPSSRARPAGASPSARATAQVVPREPWIWFWFWLWLSAWALALEIMRRRMFHCLESQLHLLPQRLAHLCRFMPPPLVRRRGRKRWHRDWLALFVDGDHGEVTAVGVARDLRLDVFGDDLHADLHRCRSGVVDRREQGDQLA